MDRNSPPTAPKQAAFAAILEGESIGERGLAGQCGATLERYNSTVTSDRLRLALNAKPFVPVVLKTTGGREYRVNHPELVSFSPGGRVVNVWVEKDAGVWIDVLMIESIHVVDNGQGKQRRRSA